jgi:hypothetical protein
MFWTVKGTQVELYATILAASWYMQHFHGFEVEIALTKHVSTFRWEGSSNYFIITQRGPRYPAVIIAREQPRYGIVREQPLYGLFLSELNTSFKQARRLPLEQARATMLSPTPEIDQVKILFEQLNIAPVGFDDRDFADIIAKSQEHRNPYLGS